MKTYILNVEFHLYTWVGEHIIVLLYINEMSECSNLRRPSCTSLHLQDMFPEMAVTPSNQSSDEDRLMKYTCNFRAIHPLNYNDSLTQNK